MCVSVCVRVGVGVCAWVCVCVCVCVCVGVLALRSISKGRQSVMCYKQIMFTTQEVPSGVGVFHTHNIPSIKHKPALNAAAFGQLLYISLHVVSL